MTLQIVPIHVPIGVANGTNSAKKKRQKMGTVSRFDVFCVTAVIFPGTYCMRQLQATTIAPMPKAIFRASRTCSRSVAGARPKRSMRSVVTTAVIEFTPESMLDMAAANMADTTRPLMPGGRWKVMKWGKISSALSLRVIPSGKRPGLASK